MIDMLFEDIMSSDNLEICEDVQKGERINFFRGVLARADYANQNKRVYPRYVMEEALMEAAPLIKDRRLVGELNHPPSPTVNMERIALYIPRLELQEDGSVIGDVYPSSTPFGDILKGLIKDGIKVGFSTRATGSVKPYRGNLGEGLVEVQKGMKLVAIDAVMNPSVRDALPSIVSEGTIMLGQTAKFKQVWQDIFDR